MSVVLYCPVCGVGFVARRTCPLYGCGHARLVELETAQAANTTLGALLEEPHMEETPHD